MRLMRLHPKDRQSSVVYVSPLHLMTVDPDGESSTVRVIDRALALIVDDSPVEVAEEWQRASQEIPLEEDGRTLRQYLENYGQIEPGEVLTSQDLYERLHAYHERIIAHIPSQHDSRTIDELKGQLNQADQEILELRREISKLEGD